MSDTRLATVLLVLLSVAISFADTTCDVNLNAPLQGAFRTDTCTGGTTNAQSIGIRVQVNDANTVKVYVSSGAGCTNPIANAIPLASCLTATKLCVVQGGPLNPASTYCVLTQPSAAGTAVSISIQYYQPTLANQFHLKNTAQYAPGSQGNDVNVESVWAQGIKGDGILIDIVDDGLLANHLEFAGRVYLNMSRNYGTNTNNPTGLTTDTHGTSCGGVSAAAENNGVCGQGAAPRAVLAGHRVLISLQTQAIFVDSMYNTITAPYVHISSNSWGPGGCDAQTGCTFYPSDPSFDGALKTGFVQGRGGKGRIYVFAAGNEGDDGGDVNMNPNFKNREAMAIGGSTFDGKKVFYSNRGAALFVNAPTQGKELSTSPNPLFPGIISATGPGTTQCTDSFGGTSSACPLAAGVIALIFQANPNLSAREVQHIVARTATKNDPTSTSWAVNGAGIPFSHLYGFGRINAAQAVAVAKTWAAGRVLGDDTSFLSNIRAVNLPIPDGSTTGASSTIQVTAGTTLPVRLEFVRVTLTATHPAIFDLLVTLTSPAGTVAYLAVPQIGQQANFANYPFGARTFWGENPVGTWTLKVADLVPQSAGTFNSWRVQFFGESATGGTGYSSTGGNGAGGNTNGGQIGSASLATPFVFLIFALITLLLATLLL